MQLINKVQLQYEKTWKMIIRPRRNTYPESSLGPDTFALQGCQVKRIDFQITNPRGSLCYCSHFVPLEAQSYPCLIYLHGNSSNRTQGIEYLGDLIKNGFSLCTFDFSGCGNSEGQYVTLGYYEQEDLNQVMTYIRSRQKVTEIAIWGRSMGAVTALLYAQQNPEISCLVCDSPFKSLRALIQDLCKKNSQIPGFVLTVALKIIGNTIQEKAKFNINDLNPRKYAVTELEVPVFFISGLDDQMISNEQVEDLYEAYKGDNKMIRFIKGGHNDTRPSEIVEEIINFVKSNLQRGQKWNGDFFDDDPRISKNEELDFFQEKYATFQDQQVQPPFFGDFVSQPLKVQEKPYDKKYDKKETGDGYERTICYVERIFKGQSQMKIKKEKQLKTQLSKKEATSFSRQLMENLQNWAQ